jgi:hypothetical protein
MGGLNVAVAEIANATITMQALLLLELDRRGIIPKADFAALLRNQVAELEANPHGLAAESPRTDLKMMRAVAGYLEGPPPKGWTPVVIDGGKS